MGWLNVLSWQRFGGVSPIMIWHGGVDTYTITINPDSKVHGANMEPVWSR